MLSIYKSLLNFAYSYCGSTKINVVLHSNCVLSPELKEMFEDRIIKAIFDFYIFEDSFHELSLLTLSKIDPISFNAKILLRNTEKFEKINLRDCYGKGRNYLILERFLPSSEKQFIFVFCEASAAEEFVMNVIPGDHERNRAVDNNVDYSAYDYLSILSFNGSPDGFDISHSYTAPVPLSCFSRNTAKSWNMRETPVMLLRESEHELTFDEIKYLYIDELTGFENCQWLSRDKLEVIFNGSFARICKFNNSDRYEGKVVKIFKRPPVSVDFIKYIEKLISYNKIFSDRISLPEATVYVSDNEGKIHFAGFVMQFEPCVQMSKLSDYANVTAPNDQFFDTHLLKCKEYSTQLALLLMEMRLFGLSMTDISGANICIKKNGESVFLVDADSIEPAGFAFKEWIYTPNYACKDIFKFGTRSFYFPSYFSEFSFAVLLFYIYFRSNPLEYNGGGHNKDYSNWKEASEAFERINRITMYDAYLPDTVRQLWCQKTDEKVKSAFLKIFNEDRFYTIGQWVDLLDLR